MADPELSTVAGFSPAERCDDTVPAKGALSVATGPSLTSSNPGKINIRRDESGISTRRFRVEIVLPSAISNTPE
jgi:hypothetical protein